MVQFNNQAKSLFYKLLRIRELRHGHESMHINYETASVTLTFEIAALFLLATLRLDMPNTCVKLFQNPSIDKRHTGHECLHFYI